MILLLSISQLGLIHSPQQEQVIRACAYENAPKIYTDKNGNITGFWPVLLKYIAALENWQIEWVHGTWEECLMWLKNGQVDVLPDTGWTAQRAEIYDFSNETVLISWTRLYTHPDSDINSILDLEGKTIAGLKGSFNLDGPEGIKEITQKFGVHSTFVEFDNYVQVFEAIENKTVDAGITNKDFGNLNEDNFNVTRTPILFQPARIQFAFTKNSPLSASLINRIDARMKVLKEDDSSVYYQALDTFLGEKVSEVTEQVIPQWVINLIYIAGIIILILSLVGYLTRKQVKQKTIALENNENLTQTIINATPDAIFIKDLQGLYILYNKGAEQVMGFSADEVLGKDDYQLLPDRAEKIVAQDKHILQSRKVITYEEDIINKNGQLLTFSTTKGPIVDSQNNVVGIFGIARDITQRAKTEKELQAKQNLFIKTFMFSPLVSMLIKLPEGTIVDVNPVFEQLFGYTREQVIGHSSTEYDLWADPLERKYIDELMQTQGRVSEYEADFKTKTGEIKRGLLYSELLTEQNDQFVLVKLLDLTNIKKTENENLYLASLLDKVSDAIISIDNDRQILSWNKAAEKIYGWSAKEAIGQSVTKLLNSQYINTTPEEVSLRFRQDGYWQGEVIQSRKDGSQIEILGSVNITQDEKGQPNGAVAVNRDISERIQSLNQLNELNTRLINVFESMADAFVSLDKSWVYTYVNKKAGEIFGRDPQDLIGKHIWTEFPEGVGQPFYHAYYQAEKSQKPITITEYYPPYDKWFENRIYPSLDGLAIFFTDITERKKFEQEKTLLEKVRNLIENELDLNTLLKKVVENIAEVFGYSYVSLYALSDKKLVLQHQVGYDHEIKEIQIKDGIAGQVARSGEPILIKDVTHEPAFLSAIEGVTSEICAPLIVGGKIFGILNVESTETIHLSDIDLNLLIAISQTISPAIGRAQLYTELGKNEEKFRLLVNNLQIGVILNNPKSEVLLCNPKSLELLGLTEKQLFRTTAYDARWNVIREDGSPFSNEDFAVPKAIATKKPVLGLVMGVFRPTTNSRVWLLVDAQPQLNSDGSLNQIITSFTDISELKKAQDAIQQHLLQLSTLNSAALQLQKTLSPQSLADEITQSLEKILNYNYAAVLLIEESSQKLIPFAISTDSLKPAVSPEFDKAFIESHEMRVGKGITGWVAEHGQTVRVGDVQNDSRYYGLRNNIKSELCVPIKISEKIIGVINIETEELNAYSDSDEKVLETAGAQIAIAIQNAQLFEQINALNATLEHRVQERTTELEKMNKELETFSYSVSHDLRAPLRAISGFAEIISRRHKASLNEEGQHYFENIVAASERMSRLIDDLLTYSRLGRSSVKTKPISLNKLLEEIGSNMQHQLDERHGILDISTESTVVKGDQTLLTQIFGNLIENALTYHAPEVNPRVRIRFQNGEKQVVVQIEDNGLGIPLEHQEKIFDIFTRLHADDEFPGTGVGLATVKKSVELLNGKIWLESQPNKGTTFFVRLPKG